jgi:DNA-directed RNA polymerase specialized sigma24 family protein
LAQAFAAVSPEDRALITLHEIEGWTVTELAELYNKPAGTIKARLSRARAKMRKALTEPRDRSKKSRTVNLKLEEAPVCVVTKPETE